MSARVLCKCEFLIKLGHYFMAFHFAPEDITHLILGHSASLFKGQGNHESESGLRGIMISNRWPKFIGT